MNPTTNQPDHNPTNSRRAEKCCLEADVPGSVTAVGVEHRC